MKLLSCILVLFFMNSVVVIAAQQVKTDTTYKNSHGLSQNKEALIKNLKSLKNNKIEKKSIAHKNIKKKK